MIDKLEDGMYVRTDYNKLPKTSHNIIDLIEVGDIVNGEQVVNHPDYGLCINNGNKLLCDVIVKEILTKEQYEREVYKIDNN